MNTEDPAPFVLGYHGTDRETGEKILAGELPKSSDNSYDWLGHGMYFWESDPLRAKEWAYAWCKRRKKKSPFVIGAVIDLGRCLNLISRYDIKALKSAHESFCTQWKIAKGAGQIEDDMPKNAGNTNDFELRFLDCAVIEHLHLSMEEDEEEPYQTVRGLFREGEPIYENAGFYEKTHIQIAVRDLSCIRGFFRPR